MNDEAHQPRLWLERREESLFKQRRNFHDRRQFDEVDEPRMEGPNERTSDLE